MSNSVNLERSTEIHDDTLNGPGAELPSAELAAIILKTVEELRQRRENEQLAGKAEPKPLPDAWQDAETQPLPEEEFLEQEPQGARGPE